jgi:hypothetical protein
MITTNGNIISLFRKEIKAVKQDASLTDRFLYSILLTHAKWLMKREDGANKLMKFSPVIEPLPYAELEEVDKIEAQCAGIPFQCVIKRTKYKLPQLFDGYNGPLIRSVTSLDGTEDVSLTDPATYVNITNQSSFKYNKTKYAWYLSGHLYFPKIDWDAVRVEGIFSDDVEGYGCGDCKVCRPRQEQPFNVPGYLHGELLSFAKKDIMEMYGIPADTVHDKQHPGR